VTRVWLGDIKAGPVVADGDGEASARGRDVDRRVRGVGVLDRVVEPFKDGDRRASGSLDG
jgi:hypothetical protein